MKKTIFLLAITVGFTAKLHAQQTLSSTLQSINLAYFNLNQQMNVSAVMRSGDYEKKVEYTAYMKSIGEYYMRTDDTEMLVSNSVKVALNKRTKSIIIDSVGQLETADLPVNMFDTLATKYRDVNHEQLSGGFERYTLVPNFGEVQKIILEFNSTTFLLRRLVVESRSTDNSLVTTNVRYSYLPLQRDKIPSIDKYVNFNQKGIAQLTETYRSYRLINFLNR